MLSHIEFGKGPKTLAILIQERDLDKELLERHYVDPLEKQGIPREKVIAITLERNAMGKAPVALIRPHLEQVKRIIEALKIKDVIVADSDYFKVLCGVRKVEPNYGYPKETLWKGVMGFVTANYQAIFYNPDARKKIAFSVKAVAKHLQNQGGMFDEQILKTVRYPFGPNEIKKELDRLLTIPVLTCDIEAYSLKVDKAGIATIAFGENMHTATAFPVGDDQIIRRLVRKFFDEYQGKLIFHGSPYDCKVIIWELYMEHSHDIEGMLEGLHILFRDLEDTKIIAYLALNSTATISLKLKDLAFEHTGNYALSDIDDITKYTLSEILNYNAMDAVATWYVHDLYRSTVSKEQESVYQGVFLPALKAITQMELCGVPINLGKVLATERILDDTAQVHYKAIMGHKYVQDVTWELRDKEAEKANKKLKKLRKDRNDFLHFEFNPGSPIQLAYLLHDSLGLPIIDTTDTGAPSVGAKTLKNLKERVLNSKKFDDSIAELLEHFVEYSAVTKILSTFIPAFKENSILQDGWNFLHGGFNLGGTKSGRLSSSNPNLQNIPSTGTDYAKPVKQCFQAPLHTTELAPKGWLLAGADYASLEDKISALLTSDPNKLAIYTDGYDGHCLRAYNYFSELMPDITKELEDGAPRVKTINSIAKRYPKIRQLSKSPTFLLTYMGTWKGLVKTFGFTEDIAKQIESNYHEMYKVSDEWVMERVRKAGKTGYVELAFGLKLRTPILPQVVIDSDSLPFQAHKEIKTAGNALGQSYGLLNTRANNEFMARVWKSEFATKVLPCMQVHDSQYYLIENTLRCLKWVNDNLIECMEWDDLRPIQHDEVKLTAELEIYYPDWANPIAIPNRVSIQKIREILKEF